MYPSREPAADVAAARDGREIVELFEHPAPRERLYDAERERAAAYAAARETECRALRIKAVNLPVDAREPQVVYVPEVFGESVLQQQPPEAHEVAPRLGLSRVVVAARIARAYAATLRCIVEARPEGYLRALPPQLQQVARLVAQREVLEAIFFEG